MKPFHFIRAGQRGAALNRILPSLLILVLGTSSCPTQITRCVRPVVVNAIERVAGRPWAEICFNPFGERDEVGRPPLVHLNATTAIAWVGLAPGVQATLFDVAPQLVNAGSASPVSRFVGARLRSGHLSLKATARLRPASTNTAQECDDYAAAVAAAFDAPHRLPADDARFDLADHRQTDEPLSSLNLNSPQSFAHRQQLSTFKVS